jgi:hypothetical protein
MDQRGMKQKIARQQVLTTKPINLEFQGLRRVTVLIDPE